MEMTAEAYFEERYHALARHQDGACKERAWELAKLLAAQGCAQVVVMKLQGYAEPGNCRPQMEPRPWPQRVWMNHWVCLLPEQGIVYDPIFPEPTPGENYLNEMFPGQRIVPTGIWQVDGLSREQINELEQATL